MKQKQFRAASSSTPARVRRSKYEPGAWKPEDKVARRQKRVILDLGPQGGWPPKGYTLEGAEESVKFLTGR